MNRRTALAAASALAILWLIGLVLVLPVSRLPDVSALDRVTAGDPVIPIRDLFGRVIYEYHSPTYGEQVKVGLEDISDELIALTITTEDSRFFTNPGFSPAAILRAFFQNLIRRRTFSGAYTITQQVVKNILIPPSERLNRSVSRKMKEIILSAAAASRYSKETILNIYLNEIYYGNNATGAEKAAENYFGKHAAELDLEEAAFIAGLPQAPNYYGADLQAGRQRQREVLHLLERVLREEPCIQLGSGKKPRSWCPRPESIRELLSPSSDN